MPRLQHPMISTVGRATSSASRSGRPPAGYLWRTASRVRFQRPPRRSGFERGHAWESRRASRIARGPAGAAPCPRRRRQGGWKR